MMAMRRKDFRVLYGNLVDAEECLQRGKVDDAKVALRAAMEFIEAQQFHQGPRGVPFSRGEDSRRKDRLTGGTS